MSFTRILVDIDATASAQPALELAVRIARVSDARLRVVDVCSEISRPRRALAPEADDQLMRRRRDQLACIACTVRDVDVETALLSGPPGEALIRDVIRHGHELLIRSRARDLVATGAESAEAVDCHLLRYCPCPVWVLAPGRPSYPLVVCAAVDARNADSVRERLNRAILKTAGRVRALLGRSLTVLQTWRPAFEEHVRSMSTDHEFAAYLDNECRTARADLARLIDRHHSELTGVRVELRRGDPEDVLPRFAVSEGVDLVVVGTMGRAGLARWLFGSTAERLMRRAPCSFLAVKPEQLRRARVSS